eukprot:NODE_7733_length_1554_cov_7.281710.p1 GENE.NODE_7733_length_1554_cov_7.281710~~NODE_7733_length_1554_cov_7.281710.p1  ORF type:complete len:462 (-),score=93.31 NODE_7733_length_1554_cov_7.281710:168-1463(-)
MAKSCRPHSARLQPLQAEAVKGVFRACDMHGEGLMERGQLAALLTGMMPPLPIAMVEKVVRGSAAADGKGNIRFNNFIDELYGHSSTFEDATVIANGAPHAKLVPLPDSIAFRPTVGVSTGSAPTISVPAEQAQAPAATHSSSPTISLPAMLAPLPTTIAATPTGSAPATNVPAMLPATVASTPTVGVCTSSAPATNAPAEQAQPPAATPSSAPTISAPAAQAEPPVATHNGGTATIAGACPGGESPACTSESVKSLKSARMRMRSVTLRTEISTTTTTTGNSSLSTATTLSPKLPVPPAREASLARAVGYGTRQLPHTEVMPCHADVRSRPPDFAARRAPFSLAPLGSSHGITPQKNNLGTAATRYSTVPAQPRGHHHRSTSQITGGDCAFTDMHRDYDDEMAPQSSPRYWALIWRRDGRGRGRTVATRV